MWSLLRGKVTGAGGLKRRVKEVQNTSPRPPSLRRRGAKTKNRLAAVTLTPDSRTVYFFERPLDFFCRLLEHPGLD